MIKQLINKEDINLNDVINYIFIKQSAFNSYCKTFSKELKDIRRFVKKVDNENIKINYQKNNNDIVLASYELINKDEKLVEILFIGFEDLKYFNLYKQFLKNEYKDYKISLSLTKFNNQYNELLNDDYFKNTKNKKTIEIFETKLNKLKIRMNQDVLVFPLEPHLNDDYKNMHFSKVSKSKNIKKLVALYNNEMIGYFDYKTEEDFNEIIEYRIDERVQNKEIVIGKALLSIFEKYHKFMNIKISLIDDPNFDDFMKWGFLLISEEKIFSNM